MNGYYNLDKLVEDVEQQVSSGKGGLDRAEYLLVALTEEVGECCGVLKKHIRDGAPLEPMILELSDVLWYLLANLRYYNLTIDDVARRNLEKLQARRKANGEIK